MENYEWVSKVPVNKLSNRSLVLISRFARQLKQINGRILALRDPEMPMNLVKEAQMANDPRLTSLLNNLLDEFFVVAESEGLANTIFDRSMSDRPVSSGDPERRPTINH